MWLGDVLAFCPLPHSPLLRSCGMSCCPMALVHHRAGVLHSKGFIRPTVVLLERMTLKLHAVFSPSWARPRFHRYSQLGGQGASGQGYWCSAMQPPTPERHLGTHLFNSRNSTVRLREIGPAGGFINFSFPLPPAGGCAKIPRHTVISLKPRGA